MLKLMKKTILTIALIITTLGFMTLVMIKPTMNVNSDEGIPYTHSLTKAICDTKNFCQDYEIFCKNKDVIKMNPITGAAVQFPDDWKDPRDKEAIEVLC